MRSLALLIPGTLSLTTCGGSVPIRPQPAAMSGAVNGSRMVVQDTYQFSFTPLSGETVTSTAQIE